MKIYESIFARILDWLITNSYKELGFSIDTTSILCNKGNHRGIFQILKLTIRLKALLLTIGVKYKLPIELINLIGISLVTDKKCIVCNGHLYESTFMVHDDGIYDLCKDGICYTLKRHFGLRDVSRTHCINTGRLSHSISVKHKRLYINDTPQCNWLLRYRYISVLCKTTRQTTRTSPANSYAIPYIDTDPMMDKVRTRPSWRTTKKFKLTGNEFQTTPRRVSYTAKDYTSFIWYIGDDWQIDLWNVFHVYNHHRGLTIQSPHCFKCGLAFNSGHIRSIDSENQPDLIVSVLEKIKKNKALIPPAGEGKGGDSKVYNTYWAVLLCNGCDEI